MSILGGTTKLIGLPLPRLDVDRDGFLFSLPAFLVCF